MEWKDGPLGYYKSESVIGWVASFFTVAGVIYGVWAAQWVLRLRRSTAHLGSVCQDEEEMGCFVADIPGERRRLWPFFIGKTPKPRLPTVSSIMRAGDYGVFTSAMFEWVPYNRRHVTWRPLYEAFFEECIWAQEWPVKSCTPQWNLEGLDLRSIRYVTQILDAAKEKVWSKMYRPKFQCIAHIQFRLFSFLSAVGLSKLYPHRITLKEDEVQTIDRHLLYYPWTLIKNGKGYTNRIGSFKPVGPILISSHIELETLEINGATRHFPEIRANEFEPVRIHAGKPCIEVSEEEISALSIGLGLELEETEHFLPHGIGAFGTLLSSEADDCWTKLKLTYHRRQLTQLIAGGGYSMLFAKHMACGCLPFAFRGDEVQTIFITEDVLACLREGSSIHDNPPKPIPNETYIHRLPGHLKINYYYGKGTVSDSDTGDIQIHSWTLEETSLERKVAGSWCEAVTRIAFGGLVPMATSPLIRAVAFTVGQAPQATDTDWEKLIELFNMLMNKVMEQWDKTIKGDVPLFGSKQRRLHQLMQEQRSIDFSNLGLRTREIVIQLAKLTTLLESLLALGGAVYHWSVTTSDTRRKEVFDACVIRVRATYSNSLQRQKQQCTSSPCPTYLMPTPNVLAILEDAIEELDETRACSVETCADVAMCVIIVWTGLVKRVHWEKVEKLSGSGKGTDIISRDNVQTAASFRMESLPDVAVWE
ncbi:hypothetical protein CI102_11874 [Trichoderma harzianum]|nr:hypothetical protein CI102_11874 [Trichoderma harzianum]